MSESSATSSALPGFVRGPLQEFEVTWTSGTAETVHAHEVHFYPQEGTAPIFGDQPMIRFFGEFDGKWRLVLAVQPSDVRSIRNRSLRP